MRRLILTLALVAVIAGAMFAQATDAPKPVTIEVEKAKYDAMTAALGQLQAALQNQQATIQNQQQEIGRLYMLVRGYETRIASGDLVTVPKPAPKPTENAAPK